MGIFDQIKNAFGGKSEPVGADSSAKVEEEEPEAIAEEFAPTEPETYTVQSGDTLWKISEQVYGDGSSYMKIFEANTGLLENPDQIFPGQDLIIPRLDNQAGPSRQ